MLEWYDEAHVQMKHVLWCHVFEKHPKHGEIFFSSVLNRHASWLDDHAHFGQMPNSERPYQCYWGDGSDFNDTELAELRGLHDAEDGVLSKVPLQKGDVL